MTLPEETLQAITASAAHSPLTAYDAFDSFLTKTPTPSLPHALILLRAFSTLYTHLPDDIKSVMFGDLASPAAQRHRRMLAHMHAGYHSIADLMRTTATPALRLPDGSACITHAALRDFVANFTLNLPHESDQRHTVAVSIPNGPVLAAVCLAVTGNYVCAPINIAVGTEQYVADVKQAQAKVILTTRETAEKLEMEAWTEEAGVVVFFIDVDYENGGSFILTDWDGAEICQDGGHRKPSHCDDLALLLFTSGTSGTKKRVPLTMHMLLYGALLVIDSWGLTDQDICQNMMPLFHVGGLLRNIFAPVLAGGSTVCCPAFDADLFWTVVDRIQPTWYYASPTMHDLIVKAVPSDAVRDKSRFRLICNAAGGLLPTLAGELQAMFHCTILPSYGMTECMPISTPPLTYQLEREGTSGVSTGPELAILDINGNRLAPMETGYINVRGDPVFGGYLGPDNSVDRSPFNAAGFFDTGDMGYMDADGYLYITGRSKEVINRGGEIISPFEIEDAIASAALNPESPIYGRVKSSLAFSVNHEVLQETVGVVLVTPPGQKRVDLKVLQSAVGNALHSAKWPFMIVYMNALPKSNNKIMRIKMAQRLSLPTINDATPYMSRHWEGDCPPDNTPLSVEIPGRPCQADLTEIKAAIKELVPPEYELEVYTHFNEEKGAVETILAPTTQATPMSAGTSQSASSSVTEIDYFRPDISRLSSTMSLKLLSRVHNYMVPQATHALDTPLPRSKDSGMVDQALLFKMLQQLSDKKTAELNATTRGRIITIMADVLDCDPAKINANAAFYQQGVDSLLVGRLASKLRTEFKVHIASTTLYEGASAADLAAIIDKAAAAGGTAQVIDAPLPDAGRTFSSTNPILLFLHLIPLCVMYPIRRGSQWTLFLTFLASSESWKTHSSVPGRLFNLAVCIWFAQMVMQVVMPVLGIISKWVLIGRYREGLYPMWGFYHTRWWLVQKIISITGRGVFGTHDSLRTLYYRLMGAKIGKNVTFKGCALQEFDLLEIGDDCILEKCRIRPFAAERNTAMYLGKITIGRNCTVGTASIVAPGAVIPDNTCIGANSSSWEMADAEEANREIVVSKIPGPHWAMTLFLTKPLVLIGWVLTLVPWAAGLVGLVMSPAGIEPGWSHVYAIVHWFAAPHRVGYHFLAMILRTIFSPIMRFLYAVLLRIVLDALFGKLKPSDAATRSQIDRWRMALMREILPMPKLLEFTSMFGSHYEMTSRCLRLLGAKVGKRVYWPGTGPAIADYHLIDIGDDVVFGSRSHFITSNASFSDYIKVGNNSMIADRVVLHAGVEVGSGTVMGSGAMTRPNGYYGDNMTFAGSTKGDCTALSMGPAATEPPEKKKMLFNSASFPNGSSTCFSKSASTMFTTSNSNSTAGSTANLGDSEKKMDTAKVHRLRPRPSTEDLDAPKTPFGRAFYGGQASYHVLGQFTCALYSIFFVIITKVLWNVPTVAALQIVDRLFRYLDDWRGRDGRFSVPFMLGWMIAITCIFVTVQAVLVLSVVVAGKWILMRRRMPGNYDWDKSSYCQRWQIFLGMERLRRSCIRGHGVLGLLSGTYYITLYYRAMGATIGKDCALFAGGTPTLYFTEPDLLTLGDRVTVDDASLVGHINSRGKFDLNRLSVGDRSVLRAGSRLLSGANMEKDTCLLEHTLIMGGEVIEEGTTMQGWTGERFTGKRVSGQVTAV
ncbi:hypothetical protein TD95_003413 [Thielaviopsis punctulata]|uniref:Carrier domain-containing protein n=1 Tax=Thielaviopsis punctulata TaxID=72032 RepID=A0A0F4Z9M6_9PEZI|nr:hypothetical protein TD95_003413 [Thielaviopsis punctulata]